MACAQETIGLWASIADISAVTMLVVYLLESVVPAEVSASSSSAVEDERLITPSRFATWLYSASVAITSSRSSVCPDVKARRPDPRAIAVTVMSAVCVHAPSASHILTARVLVPDGSWNSPRLSGDESRHRYTPAVLVPNTKSIGVCSSAQLVHWTWNLPMRALAVAVRLTHVPPSGGRFTSTTAAAVPTPPVAVVPVSVNEYWRPATKNAEVAAIGVRIRLEDTHPTLDTTPMVQMSSAGLTVHLYVVVGSFDVPTREMRSAVAEMVGSPAEVMSMMSCVSDIEGISAAVISTGMEAEDGERAPLETVTVKRYLKSVVAFSVLPAISRETVEARVSRELSALRHALVTPFSVYVHDHAYVSPWATVEARS
mmetsp:Transcript_32180/g.76403  ORF Transcript_32180/g.76403 Transcript_32180/m.76403 type:complete len:371 (+) Transcript_32180:784-1896(+)